MWQFEHFQNTSSQNNTVGQDYINVIAVEEILHLRNIVYKYIFTIVPTQ